MEAAEYAVSLFRGLYHNATKPSNPKKLSAQLIRRLEVLNGPIKQLQQHAVEGDVRLDSLITNLHELHAAISRVCIRAQHARLISSCEIREDFERCAQSIANSAVDLGVVMNLQLTDDLEQARWRLDRDASAIAQTPIRSQEADQQLRCDEARRFYDEYYNGQLSMERTEFWYCFSLTLAEEDITSSYFLEKLIVHFCGFEFESQIDVGRLNAIFMMWSNLIEKQKILNLARVDSRFDDYVDNFKSPYPRPLLLKLNLVNTLFPIPGYQDGDIIMITPLGLEGRPPTRIVRFGRGDPSLNHVSFSDEDPRIERDMYQIYCNSDGYYIIDAYNSGTCNIKIRKGDRIKLIEGSIFTVGDISLHILEANSAMIRIKVLEGPGVIRCEFRFNRNFEGPTKITIGKVSRNSPKDIQLDNDRVSRLHAKITFFEGNWALVDKGSSNGTWLDMINAEFSNRNLPSLPKRLLIGEVIGTQFYRFEIISA
jgi:hypothetical protein